MPIELAQLIASRYLQETVLGRGGAGEVYRVRDTISSEVVALKRLSIGESNPKRADLALLFEREYHTLAQLAHPCIIEVYDYGVEGGAPYYTMELLDGSDLRELAPLPWPRACALLCDVASALALLHSRRLVHRDLTPRNVRCTHDGRAKLIDFGAMAPMGLCRQLVGTPAYVAPEQTSGQELDARADLYGLGALAYWSLTGRQAFPARTFKELVDLWRTRPLPPSAIVPDVPSDLDALVMSLLSFDPAGRPSSAAEVMRRLRALGNQPADETLETARAYLTTPALVGRSEQQLALRKLMLNGVRGRGGSVLIEGGPGMGRSRLLASAMLEAKLAGALVLSASGSEAAAEDFRVLRELVDALLATAPQLARSTAHAHAARLAAVLPALGFAGAERASDAEVIEALIAWFEDMARAQPLCVAVDDLPRADALSAAFLARLAAHANQCPIVVAASAENTTEHALVRALDQLADNGTRIVLEPLRPEETEALLRSVFGLVPNLSTIAAWIQRVSGGRPGACLELAQHLVDQGIVGFADGAWTLPHKLDGLSLPSSFEQALELRFRALTPAARELAQLLSMISPVAPLALADYLELLAPAFNSQQAFLALDELVRAQLLAQTGDSHALRDGALRRMVERSLDPEARRGLHARLARQHERRGSAEMIVAYHLLHAGDWQRSFEIHRSLRARATDISSLNALFDRSEVGGACLEALYHAARAHGMSPAQLYPLQKHLIQLAAVHDPSLSRHAEQVLLQLCQDSGRVYWDEHPQLPPLERVVHCVQRAQERYEHTAESERGLAPIDAIRELAVTVGILTGVCARVVDVERVAQLPELLAPFVPLSNVIGLVQDMIACTVEAMLHCTDTRPWRQRIIDRLSQPFEGLDEITRQGMMYVLSFYQGLDHAIHVDPGALTNAQLLDQAPNYAPLASQIRFVYYQNAGDLPAAERARQERESRALLNVDTDTHLIPSLFYETSAVLLCGDLVAGKHLVERSAREAVHFPGWRPWHAYSVAVFESIRGNPQAALAALDQCIALAPAVGHAARIQATLLQVELLTRIGEAERAVAIGRELLASRQQGRPLNDPLPLELSLAYAETLSSQYEHGAARLQALIAAREATGLFGLELAVLYAQRARIALCAADRDSFEHFAVLAAQASDRLRHPGLVARLQRLVSNARSADQPVSAEIARGAELTTAMTTLMPAFGTGLVQGLAARAEPQQRAQFALDLLIHAASAGGGYLFGATPDGLRLLASREVPPSDHALEDAAAALIADANQNDEDETRIEPTTSTSSSIESTTGSSFESTTISGLQHLGYSLQPFILRGAETKDSTALAVALLAVRDGRRPILHHSLTSAICDGLARVGDLSKLGLYGGSGEPQD